VDTQFSGQQVSVALAFSLYTRFLLAFKVHFRFYLSLKGGRLQALLFIGSGDALLVEREFDIFDFFYLIGHVF
jgi:hypothetical protein